jgi:hypothetical protein
MDGSSAYDLAAAGSTPGTLADRLDDLAVQTPRVAAAAYFDLSAGVVLGVGAYCGAPQEELDAICAVAAPLLAGPTSDQVTLCAEPDLIIIQRVETDGGAALCLFFHPETDPADAARSAGQAARAFHF